MLQEKERQRMTSRSNVSRRSAIEPFIVMDVMSAAEREERAGRKIVHMEVGQPGAPAPLAVREAARAILSDGRLSYTTAMGREVLRRRIAQYYADRHGLDIDVSRIAVTTGSSAGFNLVLLAAFDVGARIAMASPGYPAYRNLMGALGIEAVEIPVGPDSRWTLSVEQVEAQHRRAPFDGLLIASPANPTGTMTDAETLAALADWCAGRGVRFISDEIYHGLSYVGGEATAAGLAPGAVTVNSFSKYYCMTGWRVGWLVLPDELVRPVERLAQSLYISTPDLSQRAAVHAFDATRELETIKAGYARNRERLLERMPKFGFDRILPVDGAFYLYADIGHLTGDSVGFVRRMLSEAGVAATPGIDFDRIRGHETVRFSFAGTEADIDDGLDRLERWMAD